MIIKRTGRLAPFESSKIIRAIEKAFSACGVDHVPDKIKKAVMDNEMSLGADDTKDPVHIERIQDFVENVLLDMAPRQVALSFIRYRTQHAIARQEFDPINIIETYLRRSDDMLERENSSMAFSLQGLHNAIFSAGSEQYWKKIMPREAIEAHDSGRIHLHDMSYIAPYCCGWDLRGLLEDGFQNGMKNKTDSAPAGHFGTALGQMCNFIYTAQGESAGAQSFSNINTLLAPFVKKDGLTYKQVRQKVQEHIHNLNIPTRVGYQCLSDDTEILTKKGWSGYDDVCVGDEIATYNTETRSLEYKKVDKFLKKQYDGKMIRLTNRNQDQLLTPEHRVLVHKYNNRDELKYITAGEAFENKSPIFIPQHTSDEDLTATEIEFDNMVKLSSYIISDGGCDRHGRGVGRITIVQNEEKHPGQYQEILDILDALNLKYTISNHSAGFGQCSRIRLDSAASKAVYNFFESDKFSGLKHIPKKIKSSGRNVARLFIETYLKGDGDTERRRTSTVFPDLYNDLCEVGVIAGYGVSSRLISEEDLGPHNRQPLYRITFLSEEFTTITHKELVDYSGIVWCPTTTNGTVIARRNGTVFITGNCPFSNYTLDLDVTKTSMAKDPIIIGGKYQDTTYSEYQTEARMIAEAFVEVMVEGDANKALFPYPIITFNVSKDFPWSSKLGKLIASATVKYGPFYFANFINSELAESDVKSMCPLLGSENILVKDRRYPDRIKKMPIKTLYDNGGEIEVYARGEFLRARINRFNNLEFSTIHLKNGASICVSETHLNYARMRDSSPSSTQTKDLTTTHYLPASTIAYPGEGGTYDLGFLIGCFAGDGTVDEDLTYVTFSLNTSTKLETANRLSEISRNYFGAICCITTHEDTKLLTLRAKSKSLSTFCREFVEGIKTDKHYTDELYRMSLDFRKGVLAGHIMTDGGSRDRIYTASSKMLKSLVTLGSTLGTFVSIAEDSRKKEDGGKYSDTTIYSALFQKLNRKSYGDLYFTEGDYVWVGVSSIDRRTSVGDGYCVEILDNNEPLFTLPDSGIVTHNCRLRLDMSSVAKHVESGLFNEDLDKTHQRGGGFFGADPLTGSIAVATISMPAMANDAKDEIDKEHELTKLSKSTPSYKNSLIEELKYNIKRHMDISMQAINLRRKTIELCMELGLYPYMKFYMRNIKARTGKYFSQHFNTIGHNGMHEALLVLGYEGGITSPEGYEVAKDILKFMNEYTIELQKEYGVLVNLEQTPAESAGVKLCRKSGVDPEMKGYYTNSTWFPAEHKIDPVDLVIKQAELNKYYTGGSALHIYTFENLANSEEMIGRFITKMFTATNLPYISISPVFSICTNSDCPSKYSTGENYCCPHCGSRAIPYARIVGYYRPIDNWNDGRKEEQRRRVGFELLAKPATLSTTEPALTYSSNTTKQVLRELSLVLRVI